MTKQDKETREQELQKELKKRETFILENLDKDKSPQEKAEIISTDLWWVQLSYELKGIQETEARILGIIDKQFNLHNIEEDTEEILGDLYLDIKAEIKGDKEK